MTNIDNILYPEEAFKDYKHNLLDIYCEDYGEENKKNIEARMNNTLYLFDTNPVDTLKFLLDNEDSIHDRTYFINAEKDYINYQRVKRKISRINNKKYYELLAHFFHINPYPIRKEVLDLDISAFNYENVNAILNDKVNAKVKKKLISRQKKYLNACKELGLEPLIDSTHISMLEERKEQYDRQLMSYLLSHTHWGRRILNKFKNHDKRFELENIITIMLQKEVGAANFRLDDNRRATTSIVYYPIMNNIHFKSIDRMFFHENRHIVEATKRCVGLNTHIGNNYQLINEIRTEKHAIEDAERLSDNVLWSNDKMPENTYNSYEEMFPYTYNFFDDNKRLLDSLAISGNTELFEDLFGKDDLIKYEAFLKDLLKTLSTNHFKYESKEKEEEAKQLVISLNRNKFMV